MRKTNLMRAVRELLADGDWHSIEEIAAECGHLISPTTAVYDYLRVRSATGPTQTLRADLLLPKARLHYLRSLLNRRTKSSGTNRDRWLEQEGPNFRLLPGTPVRFPGGSAKLTVEQVAQIKRRLAAGERAVLLVEEYGVGRSTIDGIRRGDTWGYVPAATGGTDG